MTQSGTLPTRKFDPYKNFKFQILWGNPAKAVAGISKVGMLKRTTEVVTHREGGDPSTSRKAPGRTEYDAIMLERGVTHDVEFENWANKVWNYDSGLTSLGDFRRNITLEVYNDAGQIALRYNIYNCWVSEFQAMPELDANANAFAIESIKLENEGWERDYALPQPEEITFDDMS